MCSSFLRCMTFFSVCKYAAGWGKGYRRGTPARFVYISLRCGVIAQIDSVGSRTNVLLSDEVVHVAVVFIAHVFDEFAIRHECQWQRYGPGLRIGLGVIYRDFDIHVAEILAAEPLRDAELARCGMTIVIEPYFIIET